MRGHHAFEACVEQLATAIRLGVYPLGTHPAAERELAERLARLAGDAARGDGRAARRPDWSRPRAAAAAARSSRSSRGRPSARAAARTTPARRQDWLDALDFRRIVEPGAAAPGRPRRAGRRTPRRSSSEAHDGGRRRPASRPQHRQADSRFHLTVAALTGSPRVVEAVTSVQATLHEMLLAIPVLDANIAHSDRQHAALVRADPRGQRRPGAPGHGGTLRRHRRAAARPGGLTPPDRTDDQETAWHCATTGT